MPTLPLGNRVLHYQDAGSGRCMLMLPGFPFTSDCFWPQLAAPPPGFRVLVLDHRGFGQSTGASHTTTMEDMADDALSLLDALKVKTATVAGLSMGGYVAIALVRKEPSRVSSLVFFDSQAGGDDAAGQARREAVARELEDKGMAPLVASMLPKLLAEGADVAVRARVQKMMSGVDPRAAAAASRGMASRTHGKDILPRFSGRSLVVVGEADVITPVDRAKELAALLPGSELEVIRGAGHLANLERPAEVNARLAQFLAQG